MPQYVKVSEYAQIKNIHRTTVYRWVKNGGIDAKEINGILHIKLDEENDDGNGTNATIATLRQQNCHLQEAIERLQTQLSQAHEIIEDMQQKGQMDATIIMQLTKQLEHQQLMLEDMRHRSLWQKLRVALGFSG